MNKKIIPGLLVIAALAGIALLIQSLPFWPFTTHTGAHPLEAVLIALLLGIIIKNTLGTQTSLHTGIDWGVKKLLPLAIIVLGGTLNLFMVLKISGQALVINILCVIIAFLLTMGLCRLFGISRSLGILIGVGTAICGGTAIMVTAPIVKAKHTEIIAAIGIITLFGLLAIFLYPLIGHWLVMSSFSFGVWAGTAIQAIPQVIAAGFSYSQQAGETATVVKLVRILLLAPAILLISSWQVRHEAAALAEVTRFGWKTYFPPFILGFLITMTLHSFGLLNADKICSLTASFLFTMVMAGLGLQTDIRHLLQTGLKPLWVGFIAAMALGIISLFAIRIFF